MGATGKVAKIVPYGPPLRTKVAGRIPGGLFALPSGVGKCKKIKVAVRVLSFHVEFEHTKFSNFRFSLELLFEQKIRLFCEF